VIKALIVLLLLLGSVSAHAAVTYIGAGTASGTAGLSPTPTLHASTAQDDLVVCFVVSRENTDGSFTFSAGWDEVFQDRNAQGIITAFKRIFQAGDSAPTITPVNHGTESLIAHCATWRGIDTSDPIDVVGTIASSGVSTEDVGPITGITLGAGDLLIVGGMRRNDDTGDFLVLTGDSLTFAEIGQTSQSGGGQITQVWDYAIDGGSGTAVTSKTFDYQLTDTTTWRGVMFSMNAAAASTFAPIGIGPHFID
jgi:hypothetical protein